MSSGKKIPLRKCIGCGEQKEKKMLIRVIRTPEGMIQTDESGRANGRGAYICRLEECLDKAVRSHALERSLKSKIEPEIYEKLKNAVNQA